MSDMKKQENYSEVTAPDGAEAVKAEESAKRELHPLLQSFYAEINPEKRIQFLEQYLQERKDAAADGENDGAGASDAAADAYRQALFEARHVDKKHPGKMVDRFLWHIMTLLTIYKTPGFFPKRHKKEVLSILKKMRVDDRALTDKACEEALYQEFRNAVHRYYVSCSDPSYGRTLFGMMGADAERRASMICTDLWNFSRGISRMVGLEEEMTLLYRAADDEYCAQVPEAESLDAAYQVFNPKNKK